MIIQINRTNMYKRLGERNITGDFCRLLKYYPVFYIRLNA
ncbi:MAG: hypothetical protein JWR50_2070 [Mucilaginibacter sp.]|nr:hypothetical protein [Mucilaginibacter sp.]